MKNNPHRKRSATKMQSAPKRTSRKKRLRAGNRPAPGVIGIQSQSLEPTPVALSPAGQRPGPGQWFLWLNALLQTAATVAQTLWAMLHHQ